MNIAPPIVGSLEFSGLANESILVEINDDQDVLVLLKNPLNGKVILIFSPVTDSEFGDFDASQCAVMKMDSVYEVYKIIKDLKVELDFYIIDRIDMMDTNLASRERGAQQSAYIGMLSNKKILRGANLIVTSCHRERSIEQRVTRYLSLKKN